MSSNVPQKVAQTFLSGKDKIESKLKSNKPPKQGHGVPCPGGRRIGTSFRWCRANTEVRSQEPEVRSQNGWGGIGIAPEIPIQEEHGKKSILIEKRMVFVVPPSGGTA